MKLLPIYRYPALASLALLVACGGGGGGGGGGQTGGGSGGEPQPQSALPAVSWYSAAQPLLDRYCMSCHHSGSDLAPFPLENYDQVDAKRSAMIYVLESDTMPPLGYADLAPSEAQLLLDWLQDGAPLGHVSQAPLPQVVGGFTYHRDVRPILDRRCTNCHVEGGSAPFALETYDDVRSVAAAASFAIENGAMPPWPPTVGYSRYDHERALTGEERFILQDWLQGELPEGNPADYLAPEEPEPQPVEYNLEMTLPQAYTPTLRPDDHRCFAIEWPEEEFAYVTNLTVIPDQVAEVHHVIVSIAEPEDAHHYYAVEGQDGRPGWHCLGAGGAPGAPLTRQIGGWVPGGGRTGATGDTGIGVRPGSIMVVQMHYNTLASEPTPDQSTILVATAAEVDRPGSTVLLTNPNWVREGGMPIPAGDPAVHHEFRIPAIAAAAIYGGPAGVAYNEPWVAHAVLLHMHNLGTSGRITLERADGPDQVLLDIRDWDFNWQGNYRFDREVLVQPQDRIKLECNWDNTQQNQPFIDGEQQVARYVEWGDGTGDEMCVMFSLMTRPLEGYDYSYSPSVHIESPAYRQRFEPGDLIPLRLIVNNFSLQEPGQHDHAGEQEDHSQLYAGHYHVYLDAEDDDAQHLTAWDENYYYQLPANIDVGPHTLRVSLRGSDHHALGVEQSVEFEIVAGSASDSVSLIDADDWTVQDAAQDSLAAHRPEDVTCPDNSWYEEDGALEVETGFCNYLSLAQASKAAVVRGDTLHLVLWHGDLAFEEAATAHAAVSIDGRLVWEQEVDIPAKAEIFDLRLPLDFDAPAGSRVEYHLHNHGYNSWTLLQLEIER